MFLEAEPDVHFTAIKMDFESCLLSNVFIKMADENSTLTANAASKRERKRSNPGPWDTIRKYTPWSPAMAMTKADVTATAPRSRRS